MSLREVVLWRRHLRRTPVQVSNPRLELEIASGKEQERPRNGIKHNYV
jgi:hypothetical protein